MISCFVRSCLCACYLFSCVCCIAVDADALLTAIREKFGSTKERITKAETYDMFLGLGYDKVTIVEEEAAAEGGEEGDEGSGEEVATKEKAPPKEEKTHYAEATFDLVEKLVSEQAQRTGTADSISPRSSIILTGAASTVTASSSTVAAIVEEGGAGSVTMASAAESPSSATAGAGTSLALADLLVNLHLAKAGFGEAALRFCFKIYDPETAGALKEPPLWDSLQRCSNVTPIDVLTRSHLRRAVSMRVLIRGVYEIWDGGG